MMNTYFVSIESSEFISGLSDVVNLLSLSLICFICVHICQFNISLYG